MTSKVVAKYRHLATLEICQTRGTHTQSQSRKNGLITEEWTEASKRTVAPVYVYS